MDRTTPTLTTLSSDALLDLAVQTRSVLRALASDVSASERERHARGKVDPVRDLTGQSALERATRETETMLARIEAVLTDRVAAKEAGRPTADPVTTGSDGPMVEITAAPFCGASR